MENPKTNNRIEWIDILRFIAIVCVVIIHLQSPLIGSAHGSENWWIFNIINSLSHFSIPIFVMISGALLLPQEMTLSNFLKKRFSRILFPFLFWSVVIFTVHVVLKRPLSNDSIILSFLYDLFTNKIIGIYWFIYMFIGLYLITPILSRWINSTLISEVEYFLLIWSFTLFLNLFPTFKFEINLNYFAGFIGYFILGHYLNIKEIEKKKKNLLSIVFILLGGTATISGNYFFQGVSLESYLTPNIMLLSAGIFLLVKDSRMPKFFNIDQFIIKISQYSYGIFLIHLMVISRLDKLGLNCLLISPYIGTFIVAFVVIMLSVIFLEIFKRIPGTKYISGISYEKFKVQ